MNFNYCSIIYEYDFSKLNMILSYYSNIFIVDKIIDYSLNKNDISDFINIIYSNDVYCGEKAMKCKKDILLSYFENNPTKDNLKIKIIILDHLKSIKTSTNEYIVNIKKKLRELMLKIDRPYNKYLPIHITDYKKDSEFLELLSYKLSTDYTLKIKNKIHSVKRDIKNVKLWTDYNVVLYFSNVTGKHGDDKIHLGTNHSAIDLVSNNSDIFKYNVGITDIYKFNELLLEINGDMNKDKNITKMSNVLEVVEFVSNYKNEVVKKLLKYGNLISESTNSELYSLPNGLYLIIKEKYINKILKYIHEQAKNKMVFALKSRVNDLHIDIIDYLSPLYNIYGTFICKTDDKEEVLKRIYKKDCHRNGYMEDMLKTWDNISMWIIVNWDSFKCYVNTSIVKLNYRKKYGNLIHAIDYPNEYCSTVVDLMKNNIMIYNTTDCKVDEILLSIKNDEVLYKSDDMKLIHDSHKSIVYLFNYEDYIVIKKNQKNDTDNKMSTAEKYGLIDNINNDNCSKFLYIDKLSCYTKYYGVPFHGWHTDIDKIIKKNNFEFLFDFNIDYVKKLMNTIQKMAIQISEKHIYHNDIEAYNICLNKNGDVHLIDFERYGFSLRRKIRYTLGNNIIRLHNIIFTSPLYVYLCYLNGKYYLPFIDGDDYIYVKSQLQKYNFEYEIDDVNMIISYPIDKYKEIFKTLIDINQYSKSQLSKKKNNNFKLTLKNNTFFPFIIKRSDKFI